MAKKLVEGLIVSCQALPDEPLHGGDTIQKMAYAVYLGGAKGIRCLAEDVEDIAKVLDHRIPIIGLVKRHYDDSDVFITPTIEDAKTLMATSCDIIALDCTLDKRPHGESAKDIIDYVHTHSDKFVMADVATIEEIEYADSLGVDYISTTLRGYTKNTKHIKIPDVRFMKEAYSLVKNAILVAEGGIFDRHDLEMIVQSGIKHVVIGSAITRPLLIAKYFNEVFQ